MMEYYSMLLPLALILLLSKTLAKGCVRLNLPSVVGLLLTGLLLSLIRYIPGQTILTDGVLEGLGFLAKIGVVLIMFETGIETDLRQVRAVGVRRRDRDYGGRGRPDGAWIFGCRFIPRRF